jgi:predicted Zn-dependent peptidase
MEFHEAVLPNGLEIVAECNPRAYSTAFGFFVKTGARDESTALSGVSHFLEHMVFKGTQRRSAEEVNRELDELGSHANAYTSEEQTVYHATVLPEYSERTIELLADILRPALRAEDFEMEKKVILEEIARDRDQPPYGGFEKAVAMHFGDHPLGKSVLGSEESVQALTPEQMLGYFETRYAPGNIVLAAAGKIQFEELCDYAQKYCGAWQRQMAKRELARPNNRAVTDFLLKDTSTQSYILRIADAPAVEDESRFASRLLAVILGDDSGSRYFWEFVDSGAAESVMMANYEYQQAGMYLTYVAGKPEDSAVILERVAEMELEIGRDGVSDDELERAKTKICSNLVLHGERPARRMFAIGGQWIQRREYRTIRQAVDEYQSVTSDEISALLREYPLHRASTLIIGPESARPSA